MTRRWRLGAAPVRRLWRCATAACSSNGTTDRRPPRATTRRPDGATAPGTGGKAVGFIFVGPKDDFGYNQAAYDGSQAVAKAFPDLEVLTAENVPETDEATRVMEDMIAKGAKIIFATSYGHLDPAAKVAAAHPDVVVVQQGNLIKGTIPANFGTYFGTVYEPVYLAGIAAGKATKTNKLGYVYAFPIPQTIANINAFELGAQSVNPAVQTFTVNTSNWCDPAKQAEAAKSLLDQGVDVITQHQDCTKTIIETTEAAGAMVVGYHADASGARPQGLAHRLGVELGTALHRHRQDRAGRRLHRQQVQRQLPGRAEDGDNPFVQSKFGPSVTRRDQGPDRHGPGRDLPPDGSPFTGPVIAQDGKVIFAAGTTPDYVAIEGPTFFVQGVVGKLPT